MRIKQELFGPINLPSAAHVDGNNIYKSKYIHEKGKRKSKTFAVTGPYHRAGSILSMRIFFFSLLLAPGNQKV